LASALPFGADAVRPYEGMLAD